ncbi:nucleoside-diphosphate sugar epimerase/dehydratase [Gemmobacter serpentinus]|uniref:nucleoside-diphosphate sugar epimerase/dehydratase n=1 Tax=Gemmobacter serpentinus TaxID=2652247 RepID=UPI00124DE0FC|nr:nucleoside-diphosphate sugar epimerase/dehydratase [Gemmobacter serpentinus]
MKQIRTALFSFQLRLTRRGKRVILLLIDVILPPVALLASLLLMHKGLGMLSQVPALQYYVLPGLAILGGLVSYQLGLPRIQLKSYETAAMMRTGVYAAIMTIFTTVLLVMTVPSFPLVGVVTYGLLLFMGSASLRVALLGILLWVLRQGQPKHRVLIYGAGTTGVQLAAALRSHERITPVAFIDDNVALQSTMVAGLRVLSPDNLKRVSERYQTQRVILAMPSVSPPKIARLTRKLREMGLKVQSLPSFSQLVGTEELIDTLSPVNPGQFLGREQIDQGLARASEAYSGKSVLVSGAGGSVGSELCRQLLRYKPARLVLYEVSEVALYNVDRELREQAERAKVELVSVLGSVTDSRLTRMVMQNYGINVVFHAAAYKHVPLVEHNPIAGLANNVLGTRTITEAAHEAGVDRFIMISTDKAVRPTNIMGASKRLAELVVQDMAKRSRGTVFSMVRFGNVLGSSGSVIPLFKEQIARGGPVTLTHEDVTRFFMTISEAAQLVLLAGSFSDHQTSRGGDVFLLDMGKPVRIRELAVQMIQAAGYSVRDGDHPDGDIEILVTGLRPGEKLHEELLIGEGQLTTPHSKILRAREESLSEIEMASALRALRTAVATGDPEAAREVVRLWVSGYQCPTHTQAEAIAGQ